MDISKIFYPTESTSGDHSRGCSAPGISSKPHLESAIPLFVSRWASDITRPTEFPHSYDSRINQEYIFYITSQKKYVVTMPCVTCLLQRQRCNRAIPSCGRCAAAGRSCRREEGYTELPKAKVPRGLKRMLWDGENEDNYRPSSVASVVSEDEGTKGRHSKRLKITQHMDFSLETIREHERKSPGVANIPTAGKPSPSIDKILSISCIHLTFYYCQNLRSPFLQDQQIRRESPVCIRI